MRFLALSGLQTLLLAAVTVAVIVSLYLLKLRHRRVVVASSMLWGRVLDEQQAQSLWEKLRRFVSIALAVLTGLLIALAAARPEIHALTGGGERTLLVLDTSPTMLTRTRAGQTRWKQATDTAMQLVNAAAPSSEFRVADTAGRVDSAFTSDRREIREALERMKPVASGSHFPDAGSEAAEIRFITDGVVGLPLPKGTVRLPVFEEAENVGITAFEIRATPSSPLAYEAYLEVHNFGKQTRNIRLSIVGTGRQRIDRNLTLQSAERFAEPFDLSRFEGGGIRATVQADGDALPTDDIAYAYLPARRKTRTLLVTGGNPYLETMLKLDSLVELTVLKPNEYQSDKEYDAVIFDGFAPLNPPSRPALLIGNSLKVGWLPPPLGAADKPRFTTWLEEHPVMKFVSLHDVSVEKAARVDASGLQVIAESQDHTPLILATEEESRPRWVFMTFALKNSDFPLQSGFPLFIDNTLAWFSREPLALRRQPGLVRVPLAPLEIKGLDGAIVASRPHMGETVFEAPEPGLYAATHDDSRRHIAVNLASTLYSNVNRTAPAKGAQTAFVGGWLQHELWYYMLGLAVLLIAAEWFTYHRRITL